MTPADPAVLQGSWWHLPCIEHVVKLPVTKRILPYRAWLRRPVVYPPNIRAPEPPKHEMVLFFMLNPSKAREKLRDPTDQRCNGFAARLGARSYGIVNAFTRSTAYPRELFEHGAQLAAGPMRDKVLETVLVQAGLNNWPIIMACGTGGNLSAEGRRALQATLARFRAAASRLDVPLFCLSATADGHPSHPLYLGYEHAELQPWKV